MARALPHDRLIAQSAKEALSPQGLRRKGRSRTWLGDEGWWAPVVEFQPSSWSRGTYLNVAAMWLWHRGGAIRFDLGARSGSGEVPFELGSRIDGAGFQKYESEEQFLPLARSVASRAAEEVERLRGRIRSYIDVADLLAAQAEKWGGGAAFDAAIALGLAGDGERATAMLDRVLATDDDRLQPLKDDAMALATLIARDMDGFRAEVSGRIADCREALRLPALTVLD